jgi:hypothetical protein
VNTPSTTDLRKLEKETKKLLRLLETQAPELLAWTGQLTRQFQAVLEIMLSREEIALLKYYEQHKSLFPADISSMPPPPKTG